MIAHPVAPGLDVPRGFVAVLTTAMASSMLLLFVLGALAPVIVGDLGLSRAQLGAVVTVAYAVACGCSLRAGRLVDITGARRALLVLLVIAAAGLLLVAASPTYGWLLVAAALTGIAQALANPATNKLIAEHIQPRRRGLVIGVKQSGVQLGSLLAGAVLPYTATMIGWRDAVRLTALIPLAALVAARTSVPAPTRRTRQPSRAAAAPGPVVDWVRGLMVYSLLVGGAIAAIATYLPLYAHQALGVPTVAAGGLLVAFGISGLISRVVSTHWVGKLMDPARALAGLAAGAAVFALAASQAETVGSWLLWVAAVGFGLTASAANAVCMLVVVQRSPSARAGHQSALVSLGFFAGFVVSPPLFGVLGDAAGYPAAWLLVCGELAAATIVIAWRWRDCSVAR